VDGEDRILADDFGRSLLIFLPFSKYQHYIDRLENKLGHLKDGRVSFEEFVAFQYFLEDIDEIKDHVNQYRYVDKAMFQKLVTDFEKKSPFTMQNKSKNRVSQVQIDTLFDILDLDGNGSLDQEEIIGVLQERMLLGQGK